MKLNLDLSGVSTLSSRVVLPTGNYPVEITSVEAKENKAKTGGYLQVSYRVLAGEHKNSVVTDIINIANQSEDAVRIGLSTLKTILTVSGHNNPNAIGDTNEMLGLKLNIYVEEEDHKFTGQDGTEIETTQNRFKGYYELDMDDSTPATKPATKKEKKEKKEKKATEKAAPAASNPFAQAQKEKEAEEPAEVKPAAPAFPWQQ